MSISIGIGVSKNPANKLFFAKLAEIAATHGYGAISGVDSFESDVREGVEELFRIRNWEDVYCLRSPITLKANLAFDIHTELVLLQTSGIKPKFFFFCESVATTAKTLGLTRIGLFFASEWYPKDRIRMSYGSFARFISILSLPGHWTVMTLNPITGQMEEWDELPFFYDLEV